MKKIIIALDGEHFPHGAFEFAKHINLQSDILLAGIFLSPVDYSKTLSYTGMDGMSMFPQWIERDEEDRMVSRNISMFRAQCDKEGVSYRVHKDNDLVALSTLLDETRFADLLLISSQQFYENVSDRQPNFYMEELLKKTECPVLLVPEKFKVPSQVVLAYDGSESCLFAIKQFAYLFPELASLETIVFSISGNRDELIPDYSLATELFSRHFPKLQVQHMGMVDRSNFITWLNGQPDSYIVMGSFARSLFSGLFRKSFSSSVISESEMPVFIAHK
jgi:hypothetical protein